MINTLLRCDSALERNIYHAQLIISDLCLSTISVFVHYLLEMPFYLFFVAPTTLSSQSEM